MSRVRDRTVQKELVGLTRDKKKDQSERSETVGHDPKQRGIGCLSRCTDCRVVLSSGSAAALLSL